MSFDQPYVDLDSDGLKAVRCMCCNTPVGSRVERPSQTKPGVNVMSFMKLHSWSQPLKMELSDGSIFKPILCKDQKCSDEAVKPENYEKLIWQIQMGWIEELKAHLKSTEEINSHKVRTAGLKVFRCAEGM